MSKEKTKNTYLKDAFKGICVLGIYFLVPILEPIPFHLLNIDLTTVPTAVKAIYLLLFEIIMLVSIDSIFFDEITEDIEDMKKNHKKYFNKYFKYWFLILFLMMISNLFITSVNGGNIAANEEAVRNTFSVAPIYTFVSAVLIAPLLEEFVFRKGIRKIVRNDLLFIIISGFVFGSLHVLPSYQTPLDLLYLIPYCVPGWVFAYIYKESKNIFVPAGLHFVHNGILMSLQVLMFFIM